MRKEPRARKPSGARLDIEAVGLVLVALGIFAAGVLLPLVPSGELGALVRDSQLTRFGWAAYPLPLPLLLLGGLFLMRRSPPWWPRALLGYLLLVAGLWGLTVGLFPLTTGSWGVGLRETLGATWGTLAALPALIVATAGVDLLIGWRPLRLLTTSLRSFFTGVKRAAAWLARTRKELKRRAAFRADVQKARRELTLIDADLAALADLYPGSGELKRWREEVQGSRRELTAPTPLLLREALADVRAWKGAVAGFTKDRAAELARRLEVEAVRVPGGADTPMSDWAERLGADLKVAAEPQLGGEPQGGSASASSRANGEGALHSHAAAAFERLRKAINLDLVALAEREKRLSRERDQDQRQLRRMTPRQLAAAYRDHQRRLREAEGIEADAERLERHAGELAPWRELLARLAAALAEYAEWDELADYDRTLAEEFTKSGLELLVQDGGWSQALTAVLRRARENRERIERERREWEAERAAELERLEAEAEVVNATQLSSDELLPGEDLADLLAPEPTPLASAPPRAAGGGSRQAVSVAGDAARVEHALLSDAEVTGSAPTPSTGSSSEPEPLKEREIPEHGAIEIQVPPTSLLDTPALKVSADAEAESERRNRIGQIDETLANFGLGGRVVEAVRGPTVTRFEVEPAPGEKISRFANLSDDLALAMAVGSVRIEAPIPGKSVIGLEVPNAHPTTVRFREAVASREFRRSKARMPVVLGLSIEGEMWIGDLTRMPHLLIAGSTGSGKSVAVNTLISSLLYRFLPTELRFLMIDPKMVELTPYDGIPHLLRPVVTNPADAAGVLLGAVAHMERRYKMMSKVGAKNLDQYNEKAEELDLPPLPLITIIIDELADLMITSPKEVESAIMRLAQMARATGMHLILATQRPSVDILTSLIKVNVPARMAFAVSSGHDSRTILDSMGAERLTGRGDMLFYQPGLPKAVRLQGPFVSERETVRLADFLRRQYFDDDFVEAYGADFDPPPADESGASGLIDWNDDKLRAAAELVVNEGQASVSRLQRRLSVGHARAGKLMDSLEGLGVVGPHQGSKPREVLVEFAELPEIFGR